MIVCQEITHCDVLIQVDVRLGWMEKVLMSSEQSNVNVANLVTSIDLLTLCLNALVSLIVSIYLLISLTSSNGCRSPV